MRFSEISAFSDVPRPEFCIRTTGVLPPINAPAAIATASSSRTAGTYRRCSINAAMTPLSVESGTPVKKSNPPCCNPATMILAGIGIKRKASDYSQAATGISRARLWGTGGLQPTLLWYRGRIEESSPFVSPNTHIVGLSRRRGFRETNLGVLVDRMIPKEECHEDSRCDYVESDPADWRSRHGCSRHRDDGGRCCSPHEGAAY